ncbi:ATP-binding cassette domain-containing protein [Sneathia sanguinegens]|uniref:ATP-binding cassette domain-containing protein n=1 Tax=Sneathia sanguinegens TaxID=40543 RepID=A0ABT7HIU8_9FUSO|nr:ATP-binding cassette domain-containing protein [Sneathia sanguinegens]MDK9580448.1 ATP-binding cassette domain-containing protein [Sneathia sanguinegens]
MYAKYGQKIAIVGPTGSGKTTITNLINRFYEIDSGTITFDGIDIRRINKSDLRKNITVVLQDSILFSGTILDNIRYSDEIISKEEVIEVAKQIGAHHFISQLEKGYETYISGNTDTLSQGQKQLLCLVRAKLRNTPVLILDEATSNIDTRTEKIVQDGMDKLMRGKTVFVIAHRLSTIIDSDVIMVLENGEIIERGTHAQLLAKNNVYANLYNG